MVSMYKGQGKGPPVVSDQDEIVILCDFTVKTFSAEIEKTVDQNYL